MNEKYLWELWAKCKHPHPKYGGGDMVWPIEFAQLIVRECIDWCNAHARDDGTAQRIAEDIKKDFGVDE